MTGFRTADDVVFAADSLSSAETLEKYRVGYLYDVKAYLETLETLKTQRARLFVPAHAPVTEDIAPLAQLNIDRTLEVMERVTALLRAPMTFDDLLTAVFDSFGLTMTLQQYALIGSTLRSYLTALRADGRVDFTFDNNRMLWAAR